MSGTAKRKAVQTFGLVREDKMKARYLRMTVHEFDLFLEGQTPKKVGDACVVTQVWVPEWVVGLCECHEAREGKTRRENNR
jgi:hypothetical protein